MAYFANLGEQFQRERDGCKFGNDPCPIAWAQAEYNYAAVGNEIATKILEALVKNDGRCAMRKLIHDGNKCMECGCDFFSNPAPRCNAPRKELRLRPDGSCSRWTLAALKTK